MKRIKTLHQGAICPNLKFESWLMGKIVWEANRTLTDGGSRWWDCVHIVGNFSFRAWFEF